jgi:hypothetical protein
MKHLSFWKLQENLLSKTKNVQKGEGNPSFGVDDCPITA